MKRYNWLFLKRHFSHIFLLPLLIGIIIALPQSAQGDSDYLEPSHEILNSLGAWLLKQTDKEQKIYEEIYDPYYVVEFWLGGNLEDKEHYVFFPTECNDGRFMQHFYHPYTPQGSENGLLPPSYTVGDGRCFDAVTWARSSAVNSKGEDTTAPDSRGKKGDLTWIGAIESYDYTTQSKRDAYQRLGHVAHLVGDMAQPDHVHLEPHPHIEPEGEYETWVEENWGLIQPDINQLSPVHYENMEDYLKELAKITYDFSSFEGGQLFRDESRPIDENSIFAKMFVVGYVDGGIDVQSWGLSNYFNGSALGGYNGVYSVYRSGQGFWETKQETTVNNVSPGYYYVEDILGAIPQEFPKGVRNIGNRHLGQFYTKKLLPLAVTHIAGLYQHYYDIVNQPPYVYRVTVSQVGQCLYGAYWEDQKTPENQIGSRILMPSCNTPSFIDKSKGTVEIRVEFGSLETGTAKRIQANSIAVAFMDENGGICAVTTGILDDSESVWTGTFDPTSASSCVVDGELKIQITAKDRHNHYTGRTPLGDELDQSPNTPAKTVIINAAEKQAPLQYGWTTYEPGADINHIINPDYRDKGCPTEVNNIIGNNAPIEGTCGPDRVLGGGSVSSIKTYAGNDSITTINGPNTGSLNDFVFVDTGPGDDEVVGGRGTDVVYGGGGNDELLGYGGNDILYGNEGNDWLQVFNQGAEPYYWSAQLFGGPGNDMLVAPANTYLNGGEGDDELRAGDQSVLEGGGGDDKLYVNGRSQAYGGIGSDYLYYSKGVVRDGALLDGGPGNDTFDIFSVNPGQQISIDGGSGVNDYVFDRVELLNAVRFLGGDGALYRYEIYGTPPVYRPLLEDYDYSAVYDNFTSALTVTVVAKPSSSILAVSDSQQPVATFVIEYFHNGMLDITGVEGAPELPNEPGIPNIPITPTIPISNSVYLPLIQGEKPAR